MVGFLICRPLMSLLTHHSHRPFPAYQSRNSFNHFYLSCTIKNRHHALRAKTFVLGLLAAPLTRPQRRQASTLQSQTYTEFQVSDVVAGSALAEVNAAFPITELDPATISEEDFQRLKDDRVIAEDAEVRTGGFKEQIDTAEAAGEDTTALQNGKIKNKVLKLQLQVLVLEIQAAQGSPDDAKLQEQLTKLNNNIEQDTPAAGEASFGVGAEFSGAQRDQLERELLENGVSDYY